jgi:endonuclease/exonuclease/phosphatase (EEP) superfamily protein YafD
VIVGAYLVCALAWLVPLDFRSRSQIVVAAAWTAFMVRTFVFHFGLAVLVFAALALARRRFGIAGATVPLLLFAFGPALWSSLPKAIPVVRGETIVVMSMNLYADNRDIAQALDQVRQVDPELLLLQECTDHWHAAFERSLASRYPYAARVARNDEFGAAIYSRRPFVEPVTNSVRYGENTGTLMRTTVHIGDRDVTLYNVHLLPPRRLKYTPIARQHLDDLLEWIDDDDRPVLLAGDFNFTGRGPQASVLARAGLVDVHDLVGTGRGTTWPDRTPLRWFPGLRLDHIYMTEELTCTNSYVGQPFGSDHRPVIATVGQRE